MIERFSMWVVIALGLLGVSAFWYSAYRDEQAWQAYVRDNHCVLVLRWKPVPLMKTVPDTDIVQYIERPTTELWSCSHRNIWR